MADIVRGQTVKVPVSFERNHQIVTADIYVSVDFESIAYEMGRAAVRNKSRQSRREIGVVVEAKNITRSPRL